MNLRILKKLSKKALPLLIKIDPKYAALSFTPDRDEPGYTTSAGHDRKHWDRTPTAHSVLQGEVVIPRKGKRQDHKPFIWIRAPYDSWPGTPMIGYTSGWYEPEWEERTTWDELVQVAHSYNWIEVARPMEDWQDEFDDLPDMILPKSICTTIGILRWARQQADVVR